MELEEVLKPDFLVRAEEELKELKEKIDKLSGYLEKRKEEKVRAYENDDYHLITALLKQQLDAMINYEIALGARVRLLNCMG